MNDQKPTPQPAPRAAPVAVKSSDLLSVDEVKDWLYLQYEHVSAELEKIDPQLDAFKFNMTKKAMEGLHAGMCACQILS